MLPPDNINTTVYHLQDRDRQPHVNHHDDHLYWRDQVARILQPVNELFGRGPLHGKVGKLRTESWDIQVSVGDAKIGDMAK